MKRGMQYQRGFTIVEMAITVGVGLLMVIVGVSVAPALRSNLEEAAIQQTVDDLIGNVVAAYSTKQTYDGLTRAVAIANGWYPAAAANGLALNGLAVTVDVLPTDLYAEGRNSAFRVVFPANAVTEFQCRRFLESQVSRMRGVWFNGAIFVDHHSTVCPRIL